MVKNKQRLDKLILDLGKVQTRSKAEDLIRRGFVSVGGIKVTKPGFWMTRNELIDIKAKASFVSRAGEKLYSVTGELKLNFKGKTILDVGSSTGGFTDVALRGGAIKVIAVEVGSQQLSVSLRGDSRLDLHEKTDIRDFKTNAKIDMAVIDVSFISLTQILPAVAKLIDPAAEIIALVKPQFEASATKLKHKGVIKNDHVRRAIFNNFEAWARAYFVVEAKA
ncbi:MAG: TlyA family RNA methyltransferase, partial [Candidatus Saccharimonadales bacterium]